MGAYLNEHEALDALHILNHPDTPNLYRGAQVIYALMEYANHNSDGWAYWAAPRAAAKDLIGTVDYGRREYLHGRLAADLTEKDLLKMLVTVKRFLTRERVDYASALPWAALFPLT